MFNHALIKLTPRITVSISRDRAYKILSIVINHHILNIVNEACNQYTEVK